MAVLEAATMEGWLVWWVQEGECNIMLINFEAGDHEDG